MNSDNLLRLIELMADKNARITLGDKWLVVEKESNRDFLYTVNQRSYGKRKTTTLCETHYLDIALINLRKDD